ncbi:MAG TPA: polysaccharide biosynthesis/export family protein [Luteimonas sp.]|nr:polysaccharide biosynthesis/export family protein [Luteimonas sp.]
MNIIIRALAVPAAAIMLLSGCMGQQLSTGETPRDNFIQTGEVRVVPITPELVAANGPIAEAPATVPQELLAYKPESYQIQPGDTLLVTVWDHPELSTPAGSQQQAVANGRQVQPDGTFFFPYAGKNNIKGKTIEQVRSMLTSKLGRYLNDPQVDVNVVGYGSQVTLQGAFTNTAPLDMTTVPMTLAQAVGRAGINAETADVSGLLLTRDGKTYALDQDALNRNGSLAQDIYLKAGDRIFLPFNDRKEVYVVGEVTKPQSMSFRTTNLSLTQALGRSGGLDQSSSNASAVYVIRGSQDMKTTPATVYHLNIKSPAAYALADQFMLRPGDVVFVGAAGITRWSRFVNQLLPFSGILRNASLLNGNNGGL